MVVDRLTGVEVAEAVVTVGSLMGEAAPRCVLDWLRATAARVVLMLRAVAAPTARGGRNADETELPTVVISGGRE